jgi:hypothetical protein
LDEATSREIGALLRSTSFLEARIDGGPSATILVREEGMAKKPSILLSLTAEEILRYWSLLSPEQREAFLIERADLLTREGLVPPGTPPVGRTDSLFDRFAGIFHAFARLEEHVQEALRRGREAEAVYRLLGRKYDSLPALVDKVLRDETGDPVSRYITLLTAQQLLRRFEQDEETQIADFVTRHRNEFRQLQRVLEEIVVVRARLDLGAPNERDDFLDWYERAFLAEAKRPASQ